MLTDRQSGILFAFGIHDRFMKNVNDPGCESVGLQKIKQLSNGEIPCLLPMAFDWKKTPEGKEYWDDMQKRIITRFYECKLPL